ncbi:MAG: hypothetical protein QNK42_11500 [Pseudodonghicola sp.]|nr:hypothetical protein [Pseudodonghicola sp.]
MAQNNATTTLGYRFTDQVEWEDQDGPYGLKIFTASPPENPRRGAMVGDNDVYVSRDNSGTISDVIVCKRPGETPYTSCEHFIEQGIEDLSLLYASSLLPEWQRISNDAKAFFSCIKH